MLVEYSTGVAGQAPKQVTPSQPLPVSVKDLTVQADTVNLDTSDIEAKLGAVTETAPATDTASSGLNGRLQRIAQRLTSLIGLLPAALGQGTMAQSLRVVLASDQSTVLVGGAQIATATATIANGASLSGAIDCGTARLATIIIPSGWTTANLTFQTSPDGVTYNDRYDNVGGEYTITVGGASRSIMVPLSDFLGVRFIKVRSGTSAAAVNQGAQRDLTLVLVP